MPRFITLLIASLAFLMSTALVYAQPSAYEKEMEAFQAQDRKQAPVEHPILLIGSSSFTLWEDVQDYFPGYPILNRAFGGSTLLDVIHHFDQVILPYAPKQILIYCGENDFAASDTLRPETVLERFKTLHSKIRTQLNAKTDLVYVAMKPSPSRQHLLEKYKKANALIASFLSRDPNAHFVDIYTPMLTPAGLPDPTLFKEDNLHMNSKGYAIWQPLLAPLLLKE